MKFLKMDKDNFFYSVIIFVLFSIILCSCTDNVTKTTKRVGEAKNRIIGKEYTIYEAIGYQIIEIDSVEYIATTSGGICPLVKK